VFEFFQTEHLEPTMLREVGQHQLGVLATAFDALDLDPGTVSRDRAVPLSEFGGFLPLRSPNALSLTQGLHRRGILTDARGDILRFGPAPYLTDTQLRDAMAGLGEAVGR
jgi:hypothetical protein